MSDKYSAAASAISNVSEHLNPPNLSRRSKEASNLPNLNRITQLLMRILQSFAFPLVNHWQ